MVRSALSMPGVGGPDPASPRGRVGFGLAVGALLAAFLAVGIYFAYYGRVNQDEGWYLYAARMVYQGAFPYRDFAFFQAPLLPYVYGLFQNLFGDGLLVGRLTSLALGVGTIALGSRLAFERGGRLAALLFLAVIPMTPMVIWCFTTTRTQPLVAFLLMTGAFLLLRPSASALASSGALLALLLAAATRISLLVVLALVFAGVYLRHRRSRSELFVALLPATLVGAALLLVAFGDLDLALFNLITSQAERHDQLQPAEAVGLSRFLITRLRDLANLHASFGIVPALSLAYGCGVAALWLRRSRRSEPGGDEFPAVAALTALALAAYLPSLVVRIVWPIYFAPVFPLLLIVAACAAGHQFERAARAGRGAIITGVAVLLLFQAGTFASKSGRHLSSDEPDLRELREVALYLAEVVPAGQTLLTMDTYLAVESGRRVPSDWEMGIFSYWPTRSEDEGRRFKLVTDERLSRSLSSATVGAVVLSDRALGILLKKHHKAYRFYHQLTEEELKAALPGLEGYHLAAVFQHFGQFRDNLYILLPDDVEASPGML